MLTLGINTMMASCQSIRKGPIPLCVFLSQSTLSLQCRPSASREEPCGDAILIFWPHDNITIFVIIVTGYSH